MTTNVDAFTQALYHILVLTAYPQEKIQDFLNQTTLTAYTESALDLAESLKEEERILFVKQMEGKSGLEVRQLLIEKFGVETLNSAFAQNLESTLRRFIDHVSSTATEEQKKIFDEILQTYLQAISV
ncbi:MAG TPA: hypothetical protein VFQ63_03055 [Patescibacteria group bacterium]|nr:hypothetical protein [Patescibacteria group bacterium]